MNLSKKTFVIARSDGDVAIYRATAVWTMDCHVVPPRNDEQL
ncbi:MAG: hypothetical protein PHF46_01175 [Candidatus Gracilibacteria bacterium]|nr:hypothetical protein [Candidatus Gracilibacteria bacterium]MDD3120002.1 hypothetical protein [Candidatus Gracilibacteria bacterium]